MPLSQTASPKALRELSGFVAMIAMIVVFAGGKAVLHDTMDPDFFWHMRVAEQLQHDGVRPIVDQLSFASQKTPWTPYSWLAELGMKWLWDHAGLRGAIMVQATLQAIFILLVAACATQLQRRRGLAQLDEGKQGIESEDRHSPEHLPTHRKSGPASHRASRGASLDEETVAPLMSIVLATALAAFLSLPYLSFRPVLAAIDLLALCALLLLRDRRLGERTRLMWVLPAFAALLINLHIFAVFLPLWVAALAVGAWIERSRAKLKRYCLLLALCLAGCCCTPMLVGTFKAICDYAAANPLTATSMIAELEPMYRGLSHQITLGIVGVIAVFSLFNRRPRAGDLLWFGGMMLLWIKCGRAAPIFAPILVAVMCRSMPRLSDRVLATRWVNLGAGAVVIAAAVRIGLALPDNHHLDAWLNRHGPDVRGYPTAAADFIATNIRPTNAKLINEFDWGGYLAWKLPAYQVLLDGRTQLYAPAFWHAAYLDDRAQTTRLLSTITADAAVLPIGKSRFRESLVELGWKEVFKDDRAQVLTPPASIAQTEN